VCETLRGSINIDFVTAHSAAPVNSLAMVFFYSGLVLPCQKVVFAQLPEGVAELFLREQIVLEEKLADFWLPDLLMP